MWNCKAQTFWQVRMAWLAQHVFLLSSGLYISQTFTNSFLIVVGFAVCDTKTGSVLRCIQTHTEHLSNQKKPANPMVIAAAVPSRSIGQVELWAGQPWPLKSMWILTVLKLDIFKTFQDCRLHLLIGFACRCLISRGMVARLRSSSAEKASCEAITHLLKKIFPKVAWCITKWWKSQHAKRRGYTEESSCWKFRAKCSIFCVFWSLRAHPTSIRAAILGPSPILGQRLGGSEARRAFNIYSTLLWKLKDFYSDLCADRSLPLPWLSVSGPVKDAISSCRVGGAHVNSDLHTLQVWCLAVVQGRKLLAFFTDHSYNVKESKTEWNMATIPVILADAMYCNVQSQLYQLYIAFPCAKWMNEFIIPILAWFDLGSAWGPGHRMLGALAWSTLVCSVRCNEKTAHEDLESIWKQCAYRKKWREWENRVAKSYQGHGPEKRLEIKKTFERAQAAQDSDLL